MAIDNLARSIGAAFRQAGGSGGKEIVPLEVTENGTYQEEGKAYSPVTVNVPNTYSQEDEGKVVDNGMLVEQTSITITQNSTVDTTLNNEVVVNVQSGGGGGSENDNVRFLDYDGSIVKSYTASEFANLESFPTNPTHEGLISQGWNWSLEDAKSYVNTYGELNIGQMYITNDGKTRLYVHLEKSRLHPYVGFGIEGTAVIDWGDGSESTVTGTGVNTLVYGDHEYANEGDYVVTIDGNINIIGISNGCRIFCKNTSNTANIQYVYFNCIQKIELGDIYAIGNYAFSSCTSLASITIPDSITSIDNDAFNSCYSLTSITIPSRVTSIGSQAFVNCYSLSSVTIPDSVTSIGSSAFSGCRPLTSITIPDSVTSIGSQAFQTCSTLASITIPNSVTSIDNYVFSYCYSLASIIIPNSVTSIGTQTFNECRSLTSITIPSNITSIGRAAFQNCYGLGEIRFEPTTPPTVSASNAWLNVPTECKIYVPQGTLSAYTSATNYPSSSTYTYIEY